MHSLAIVLSELSLQNKVNASDYKSRIHNEWLCSVYLYKSVPTRNTSPLLKQYNIYWRENQDSEVNLVVILYMWQWGYIFSKFSRYPEASVLEFLEFFEDMYFTNNWGCYWTLLDIGL